jgi:hypothetical protein
LELIKGLGFEPIIGDDGGVAKLFVRTCIRRMYSDSLLNIVFALRRLSCWGCSLR